MHPFMVLWATPLYSAVFDEFARAGIVSVGGWHFDASIFNTRRPYRYDVLMDGSRSAQVIADYYCKKMEGKPASNSGARISRLMSAGPASSMATPTRARSARSSSPR